MAETNRFWKPVPFPRLRSEPEGPDWIWEGILARRRITLLTSVAKAGKSTLLSLLLREMRDGGQLCGCPVRKGRAVVVTEESQTEWAARRDALGIGEYAEAISLPFLAKPNPDEWLTLLQEGARDIRSRGIDLVVLDTLSHLWPVLNENDNAQQQLALMPLRCLSESNAAVLLAHHAGASGERSRGGTELEGFPDQLAHFQLTNPDDLSVRDRRLTVKGRLTSSPARITMSLSLDGADYQVLTGGIKPVRSAVWRVVREMLPDEGPGITTEDMQANWPPDMAVPSADTLNKTLGRRKEEGEVARSDARPPRWWLLTNRN